MSSYGLPKMNIRLSVIACVAGLGFATVSLADPTDDIVNSGLSRAKAAAASQARINQVSEATEKVISRYQQQSKLVDSLKSYNDRMRRTITAQTDAMAKLERSIEDASLIERQIVPLMMRMIEGLDAFVKADLPFQKQVRQDRVDRIRGYLTNANISAAERFRQVLQAYSFEAGYGKTLNAYTDSITVEGESLSVNVLQIGRTGLYYQTLDGAKTGHWDRASSAWQELDSSYADGVNHAIRVVQGKEPSESLLELPIAAPEAN
ncbi:MAG TPA: hypothetical protein DCW52_05825 [Gammaproteobacteria bacterium]|jgi:hypothetical protein|nr:hypothetical protein [Gammaproteobacteria bacterium]